MILLYYLICLNFHISWYILTYLLIKLWPCVNITIKINGQVVEKLFSFNFDDFWTLILTVYVTEGLISEKKNYRYEHIEFCSYEHICNTHTRYTSYSSFFFFYFFTIPYERHRKLHSQLHMLSFCDIHTW